MTTLAVIKLNINKLIDDIFSFFPFGKIGLKLSESFFDASRRLDCQREPPD